MRRDYFVHKRGKINMVSLKKAVSFFSVFTLLAGLANSVEAADAKAEVAAMHAVDLQWMTAYNSGKVDDVANLYEKDAILLAPGAPGVIGREGIRRFFATDIGKSQKEGVVFTLGDKPDGGVSGKMGWGSGTYVVKDKTGKVVDAGKYLSVYTKENGKWHYVRDTWNSDSPVGSCK